MADAIAFPRNTSQSEIYTICFVEILKRFAVYVDRVQLCS
jgi:hypothetical protein